MVPPDAKWFAVIPPQAIKDNGTWTPVEIDTLGYQYLEVIVYVGALDIALTVLKMREASSTSGSFADVTGCVFGTSVNSAGDTSSLPAADEDDEIFVFNIDLRGLERFFSLIATIGDGSTGGYLTAIARLSNPETAPNSAAEFGASQVLQAPAFVA